MPDPLIDPIAIVTGADSGIGRAAALALARDGHDIVITYRSDRDGAEETAAMVRKAGRRAHIRPCDQTRSADIDALFADLDGMGSVAQGFLEESNVSVVEEMVQMILGQRAYEANSRVIRAADEMLQQVNNLAR